uniref:Uncharacterized protein n=1 Tax=Bodo saltans TaxID=75058 RepID=B6DTN5_BODSA|nr:hypothetical protein [Bodo saltans]
MRYSRNRTAVAQRMSSNLHAATSSSGLEQQQRHHQRPTEQIEVRSIEPHPPRATSESSDHEVSKLVEEAATMVAGTEVGSSHNSSPRREESQGMDSPIKKEEEEEKDSSPRRVSSLLVVPTSKHASSSAFEMRKFLSGRLSVSFGFDPEEDEEEDDSGAQPIQLKANDLSPNKSMQHERRSFLTRALLDSVAAAAAADATNDGPDAFEPMQPRGDNDEDSDDVSSVSAASRNEDDDDNELTDPIDQQFLIDESQIPQTSEQEDIAEVQAERKDGTTVVETQQEMPSALVAFEIPTAAVTQSNNTTHHKSKHIAETNNTQPDRDDDEEPPATQHSLTSMSSFYSRVMQTYRAALEGGSVVLEHNPFHAHLTPQHMQGDAAMYDEENMQKRLALQHSPATISLLQAVWDAMPKIVDGRKTPASVAGAGTLGASSRSTSRPRGLSTSQNPATGGVSPSTPSLDSATPPPMMGGGVSARGSVDPMAISARSSSNNTDDVAHQVITYNVYRAMSAYVFRRLVPSGNVDEFLSHCAADWKAYAAPSLTSTTTAPPNNSSSGNTSLLASIQKMLAPAAPPKGTPAPSAWVMNKSQFFKAMFGVVDVWTESADAEEYHDFMHRVLLKQAKKISDIDPHAFFDVRKNVFASGAFRKRRVKKEVRRVSRTPQRSPATGALTPPPTTKRTGREEVQKSTTTPPSLSLNVFLVEKNSREASHPVHERAKDKLRSAIDKVLQQPNQKRRGTRFMSVFQRLTDNGTISKESDPSSSATSNEDSNAAVTVLWTGLTPEATFCPMYDAGGADEGRRVFNLEELCAAISVQDERVDQSKALPPSVVVVDDELLRDDALASQQLPVLTQRNGSRMIVASTSRIDEAMEQLAQEVSAHMMGNRSEALDPLPLVETPPADHELQHLSVVGMPEIVGILEIPTAPSPATASGSPHSVPAIPPPQLRQAPQDNEPIAEIEDKSHAIAARQKESITTLGGPTPASEVPVTTSTFAIAHHSLKGKKFVRAAKPAMPQPPPPPHQAPPRKGNSRDRTEASIKGGVASTSTALTTSLQTEGDNPSATELVTTRVETRNQVSNSVASHEQQQRSSPSSPPSPIRFAKRQPAPSHHSTRGPRPPKFRYETAPSALVAKHKHYRQECGEVIAQEILDEGLVRRREAENARARLIDTSDPTRRAESPSSSKGGLAPSSARTQASTTTESLHPQEQLVSAAAAKNPRIGVLPQGVRGNLPPGALRVVRTVIPRIVADTKSGKIIVVAPDSNPQHRHHHHRGPIPPAQRGPGRHPVQLMVYEHYDRPYLDRILTHPEDDHQPPSALREEWRAPKQRPGETLEAILCQDAYKYPKSMTALARAAIQEYEAAVEHLDDGAQRQLRRALPTEMHQMLKHVVSQRQSEKDHSSSHEKSHGASNNNDDGDDGGFGQQTLAMQIAGLANQQNPNLLLLALLSAKQREELDARDCNRSRARSLGHLDGVQQLTQPNNNTHTQQPQQRKILLERQPNHNSSSSTVPTLPPISSASARHQLRSSQDGGVIVVIRSPTSDSITPVGPLPPSQQQPVSPPQTSSLLAVSAEELVASTRRSAQRRHVAPGSSLSSSTDTPVPSWDQQMDAVVASSQFSPALHRGHLSTIPGRHSNSVLAKYNDHQQSSQRWSSKILPTWVESSSNPAAAGEGIAPFMHSTAAERAGKGVVVVESDYRCDPVSVLDRPNLFRAHHDPGNSERRAGGGGNVVLELQRRKERNDPTLDPSHVAAAYSQLNAQLVYEIEVSEDTQRKERVHAVLSAVENTGAYSRLRQHAAQAGRAL